jgi:FMN-dependent NADH-azoreductase
MNAFDFQEPYLRAIFGFVGVTDLEFLNVQPMDVTPEIREAAVAAAIARARGLARSPGWSEHSLLAVASGSTDS